MSGFVCILDRTGASLDPRLLDRVAEPLESYGDTLSSSCRGPVAIAVRHAAGVGERGRHGPLVDGESGLVAAVAGRFAIVGEGPSRRDSGVGSPAPDCASMALAALLRREENFLAGVSGSFALVAASPGERWLSVARDHLGDLKVYFHLDRRWLIAASEPAAILRHGAVGDELDEVAAARFLGFRFSQTDRSFFRQIAELPPAHRLRVTAVDSRAEQYWRFRIPEADRGRSPEGVRREFLGLLRRSIRDRMAGLEPEEVALSLSGGLDSTALAALAPRGVRAFSWVFKEGAEREERRNIEAVAEHLKARVRWVDGDGHHPLCGDFVDRFAHGNSPYINPFAGLKDRLYRAARAEGCRRVMVGDGGDALYSAREYWLRDVLAGRRSGALGSLLETAREAAGGDRFARLALRRLLPLAGARRLKIRRPPEWLTGLARSLLPEHALSPILPESGRRRRYDLSVGSKHTELESEERRLFAQCGVGRSSPFWSWRLLEYVNALPAWWLHRDGRSKVLTREAMRGLLPRRVLESGPVGLLGSFFLRGIASRRRELRETVFRHPRSDWQRYVERSWVEPFLEPAESAEFGHTILWRVISYELWQRHLMRAGWPTKS